MPVNGMYRAPQQDFNNWHFRGGLQGFGNSPQVVYTIDPVTNEQTPYIVGTDSNNNPVLLDPSSVAPYWLSTINAGIDATKNIFGSGRPYQSSPYGTPYASPVSASTKPDSIAAGLGISTQTLWLLGIGAIIFLFGKRR